MGSVVRLDHYIDHLKEVSHLHSTEHGILIRHTHGEPGFQGHDHESDPAVKRVGKENS